MTELALSKLLRGGRKAVCVGKNFHEHITELADFGPAWESITEQQPEPVLFLKPTTSYAWPGEPVVLPRPRATALDVEYRHGVQHELELGVIIGEPMKDVDDDERALRGVAGFVVGLDITDRDEQTEAKRTGMPWSVSKAYDTFLPLSRPFSLDDKREWRTLRLWLDVNGERRQACEAGTMIHSVPRLLCFISSVMTLEPGDLVLTGTPRGVGGLQPGDLISAGVEGYAKMDVDVVKAPARRLDDPFIIRCPPIVVAPAVAAPAGRTTKRKAAGANGSLPPPLPPPAIPGALSDITFAAKDNLDVAGWCTGNGSPDWGRTRGARVDSTCPAVAQLCASGARLLGKAHMDELAFSIGGENAHYGTLDNPKARGRTVGGSSSGSAVCVAGGLVDVALGTDTTGSVRVPAAHCGLYGLRPTHGALSANGVCALAPSFDTVGWFARTAPMLQRVGVALLPPSSAAATETQTPHTVFIAEDCLLRYQARSAATTAAGRTAVWDVARALAGVGGARGEVCGISLGARMLEACPTLLRAYGADPSDANAPPDGMGALCRAQRDTQAGEMWASLGEWVETPSDALAGHPPTLGADVKPRVAWAKATAQPSSYAEAATTRKQVRDEVRDFFDALLPEGCVLCFVPVAGPPPPPDGPADLDYRTRTFELQGPAGMAGLPQLVIPAATCPQTALPLAVTLLTHRGHDHQLLSWAAGWAAERYGSCMGS